MAKNKTNKRKQKSNKKIKFINIILIMIVISLSATIASYFFLLKKHSLENERKNNISKVSTLKEDELELDTLRKQRLNKYYTKNKKENNNLKNQAYDKKIEEKFEEYSKDLNKIYIEPIKKTIINKKELKKIEKKVTKKEALAPIISLDVLDNKKPKLAIVIDDMTLSSQVKKIQALGYRVTMAFMPPTAQHPNSATIVKNLPFYMIHFPLQAKSFKFEEENTLHTTSTKEQIEKRVKEVRALYPNARYTNNHTGSKFTSHEASMNSFIQALKKYNFIFVDSRTTSKSLGKKYTKKYGMPYIARNVFLDNTQEFSYIQNQLKQAIRIAKKRGHAIAIGHPYSVTIDVLNKSKHLLKGLDLVYVNKIPTK